MEQKKRTTPEHITSLQPNEIFVFGSNLQGMHGGGAAYVAHRKFGAIWGQPEGIQGQSYAIPVDFGKGNVTPDIQTQGHINPGIQTDEEVP